MVSILMSVYNGEKFLKTQLDSILNQTYKDFKLYIRNDGSKDSSAQIIESYDDDRIIFSDESNVGASDSFFELLRTAPDSDYIFFSDQDDLWYPEKLELLLEEIKKYDDTPTMIFTDFKTIDGNGDLIDESYEKQASLNICPGEISIEKIIVHPYVFGCASVINKKLAQIVRNQPQGIEMHDCWISQTASAVGKLIYMPVQTIAHRFHNNNATGKLGSDTSGARLERITKSFSSQVENSRLRLQQINILLNEHKDTIKPETKAVLEDISKSFKSRRIVTVAKLIKHKVTRQKMLNTIFFYITVLGIKGDI